MLHPRALFLRWRRILQLGCVEAGLMVLLAEIAVGLRAATSPTGTPEVIAYYTAARIMVTGRLSQLYDLDLQARIQSVVTGYPVGRFHPFDYINPPSMALFLGPLGLVDLRTAWLIWAAVSAVAIVLGVVLLVRGLELRGVAAWATGLVCVDFTPVTLDLLHGQSSAFVFLSVVGTWYCLKRGRPLLAGAALSLGMVKPQLILAILVLLLATRAWRTLGVFTAVVTVWFAATTVVFGPQVWIEYLRLTGPAATGVAAQLAGATDSGSSVRALSDALGLPGYIGILTCYVATVLFGWYAFHRGRSATLALFPLATVLSILLSPHLGVHDTMLLLLPFMVVALDTAERQPVIGTVGLALVVAGYLGLAFTDVIRLVPMVATAMVILALAVYLLVTGLEGSRRVIDRIRPELATVLDSTAP